MAEALAVSGEARRRASPNPWVGCVVVDPSGDVVGRGATEPPGGRHAEVVALDGAGDRARGATAYVTLEPCSHHGRTPPCTERLIAAGVSRVVAGILDPDPNVSGEGIAALERGGVRTELGVLEDEVSDCLRPYLTHRRSGRPYVVLKLAATLDGRIAAPDGSSRWITGDDARLDAHELRADSDAILVGAGTARADDPELTVRLPGERVGGDGVRQPLRVVVGRAPAGARAQPALELSGDPRGILEELGRLGVLQLLVEGGATIAAEWHRLGLVDRYVLYLAPAFLGGDDGIPMFRGPGAPTMSEVWRGRIVSVERLGVDLRLDITPPPQP
jgi:diaminohydroxyphosphoribosylaminopyrimidine deaminase/5-amino-6-(5-phosphoribosylamino)uracil reductase